MVHNNLRSKRGAIEYNLTVALRDDYGRSAKLINAGDLGYVLMEHNGRWWCFRWEFTETVVENQ